MPSFKLANMRTHTLLVLEIVKVCVMCKCWESMGQACFSLLYEVPSGKEGIAPVTPFKVYILSENEIIG